MAYHDDLQVFCCNSMACPNIFIFNHLENHHDSQPGGNLDPGKPGYTTSCQGGETGPYFSCTFSGLFPQSPGQVSKGWLG